MQLDGPFDFERCVESVFICYRHHTHLHLLSTNPFIPASSEEDPTLAVKAIINQKIDVEIPKEVVDTARRHITNIPILGSVMGPLYPIGTGTMKGKKLS